MSDEIISILEPILAKAQKLGADEVELFAQRNKTKVVNFETSNLKSAEASEVEGVGIRVLINKAIGFASVNTLKPEKIITAVKEAIAIAKVSPPEDYYYLPSKQKLPNISGLYDKEINSFTMDDVIDHGKGLLKAAIDYDKRISIDSGTLDAQIRSKVILNSNGINAAEEKSVFNYGLIGMAVDGDDVGSFSYEFDSVVHKKDVDVTRVGETFTKKCLEMLGATKTESFEGTAIFTPEVAADLFGLLIFSVTATNIQAGSSYLQDKLGDKVAVDNLNVYDDGTIENQTGSSSFDREGTPHEKLSIIDKGTFTGVLYDSFTANKEKLKSTGHARGSFRNIPSIGPSNLFIEPGTKSIDDIISESDNAILIHRMSAMPDPIAGDYSGVIKGGKLIKKGEQVQTLKEVTAVGNVFVDLNNITQISKDIQVLRGSQNWFVPYIAIDGMKFVS